MASNKGNKKSSKEDPNERVVCRNRRAKHDYEILEEMECGIVLHGSEVKAIRDNKVSIDEAYARVEHGEVWLLNADIAEYPQATYLNHARRRPRKLLMKRRDIRKFAEAAMDSGTTMIPTSLYLTRGLVKIRLAAAKGRKSFDKRDRIKGESDRRVIKDAMRKRT